ncbi:hypothetical protein [Geobacter sp. SVR]|uniref:hypothetical protein n=1 Tax=Geobacter sp. SVR TaxID=2495594 RepID=UPI00143EF694|nr:hypothetical protein [Geobacter sp. SVR]BCS55403.1 hypothetical protein GSVR_37110 [Geobacter sp. SVR]GCF83405.1 hypothetical protein GSbR_00050 [Geobacter sp. SVR]
MITISVIVILGMFALIMAPWIGDVNTRARLHPTDLMAGDEGEDDSALLAGKTR